MDPLDIFFFLILIFSIILHEVSHGYMADALGDHTARYAGRLTLNPLPHIDLVGSILIPGLLVLTQSPFLFGWAKPVPYNHYNLRNQKWGEALVAGAGPGVNILLAVIFGLLVRFAGSSMPLAFGELASLVVIVNVLLAIFNLIPIPPLDGSKLLRSVLPHHAGRMFDSVEQFMYRYGLIALFIMLFFLVQFISPAIGFIVRAVFVALTGEVPPY